MSKGGDGYIEFTSDFDEKLKDNYTAELSALLNDEIGGYYLGGSLCIKLVHFTLGKCGHDAGTVGLGLDGPSRGLTADEAVIVAKLYLKHKTPENFYYKRATEIVEGL
jgi:hypothetical protein